MWKTSRLVARVAKLKRGAMFSFGCTATVMGNIPLTHAVDARRFYGSILQVALPPTCPFHLRSPFHSSAFTRYTDTLALAGNQGASFVLHSWPNISNAACVFQNRESDGEVAQLVDISTP